MGPEAAPETSSDTSPSGSAPAHLARRASSQPTPRRPVRLALPGGVVVPVDPVGTRRDGALHLPGDIHRAGWWRGSSRLGDPFGAVVVAAHVDSLTEGVGPFVALLSMHAGDRLQVAARHRTWEFEVSAAAFVRRTSLNEDSPAFSPRGPARLVLITCGGPFDAAAGGYRDNVVVVARPTGIGRGAARSTP